MIKIFGLNKSYGKQVLFEDLGFSINRGEKIGLVGRNGHGKSTLFQMILGNVEYDSGTISAPKGYKIGHLEQHLKFTKPTVLEECALGLPEGEEYETWQVEKILSGLGFSENDMERSPSEFSGGYQIRMNLAKLLVSRPDMLMLDEPNNYLDIVTIRWLEEFLHEWEGEIVLITHDRSFMDSVVTHTVAIHRKKAIKVEGDTEKLYNQINQAEEIYEKTRLNEEKKRKQEEIFIAKFKAKASFASRTQSRVKKLEKQGTMKALENIEDLELYFNSANFAASQMMSAEEISFSYTGKEPYIINKFSLSVGNGDRICIIGKNGKGKSTLLKILAGEFKPVSGTVNKHPVLKEGYFGQTNKLDLNDSNTIVEEIMSADKDCNEGKARNIAGGLMFSGDSALKKIKVLSGGEKSRVLLGKILVTPCSLLFLDEPTNHLDMQSCDALIEAIDQFEGSVIMVTHNEMHLRAVATKLVVFDNDMISIYDGGYDDFLADVGWSDEDL
ncbi:MAG TPA: ABC-F family ATP-binding cassette domain-containing protein [Leptospiraceae bacterium]|nr:ABC-F family ATP-binding cassette domain-containing protein [Leptospiraceae bacterium]HMZ57292.1 ABC-F family ATP-binding cassette domain-containing protein [Leptospiraceae bacterium]HNF12123.1 ABC-F family ATP-binding cassette domain-containing protein [Leptospiraceae bacterium]HNF23016.1 ABC-F family ATP-binding cassette domain-containing protein [Leptospiraceae bacterium]HNI95135.1 ABC-F family ATP-binding cassette domain-containing protein [Leptospiraceae bacterium]